MNHRRIARLAAVALLALSAVACGGSDEASEPTSDTLSAEQIAPFGEGEVAELRALLASYGAPIDETKCVAEALAGNVDQADLRELLAALDADDADIDAATATQFNDAVAECGLG